jgi:hypothetical protein
MQQLKI